MKELRLTLYEIVGYFVPGMVALLAIVFSIWGTKYWQVMHINVVNFLSRREIILLLLFAYFLGHAVQAIGNLIERDAPLIIDGVISRLPSWSPRPIAKLLNFVQRECGKYDFSLALQKTLAPAIERDVSARFDLAASGLDDESIFRLCDAALLQEGGGGTLEEREICTYREGFYRGTSLGLVLVTVSLFVPLFTKGKLLLGAALPFVPPPYLFVVSIIMSALGSLLFFRRYRRFRQRRINYGFSGLMVLVATQKSKPAQEVDQFKSSS